MDPGSGRAAGSQVWIRVPCLICPIFRIGTLACHEATVSKISLLTGWPWRQVGLRVSCACMRRRRQYIYGAPRPVHGHRYQQSPQGFHISQARSVPEISRAASPVFNYYLLRACKWIASKTAHPRHSIPCVFVSSETTYCPAQQIESMLGDALSQ